MRNQFSRSFYTGERFTRVARNDDLGVEVYRDNNPKHHFQPFACQVKKKG